MTTVKETRIRREVEQNLLQMEARYRGLLEAAPDAMVVVDQAGAIVALNVQAEKQFGYQPDELLGQSVTNIIPVGFAERLIADDLRSAANALAQQIGTGIELSARRKDGTEFPIEIMLSPLENDDGILVTAAIRDITVRRMRESELLQAQKLESIGRLAGGIAHDFNNVLSIILGYADLLGQDLSAANRGSLDLDGALHSAQTIRGAADRGAALTSQLLAFSRRQVVKSRVLDLNASIAAVEPMLTQLIGRSVSLVLKLDPAAGNIRADAGQIDQIVVNLVVNARDAMPDGGTVTIETAQVGGQAGGGAAGSAGEAGPYAVLIVSDTGLGMDHATRERAFEPYFTTKGAGKGTGLGLATTHAIVNRAGGRISLESELGHGSTFRLSFPRVDAPPDAPSQSRPAEDVNGAGRILFVEAETELREVLARLLRRAGYDVLAVADAEQAVALATLPGRFDALVTDVDLPNASGIELAEWMMAHDPRAGVVLISGYDAETFDLDRLMAAGATFAPKPITSARLLDAVLEAVA